MARSRKKYTREFKIEAFKLVLEDGRTVTDVAKSLGIDRSLLQRWKSEFRADGEVTSPCEGCQKP